MGDGLHSRDMVNRIFQNFIFVHTTDIFFKSSHIVYIYVNIFHNYTVISY